MWRLTSKLYRAEKWYCESCEEVTPLERNPEWDGSLQGEGPAPAWFVRCAICNHEHPAPSEHQCPECGAVEGIMLSTMPPYSEEWDSFEYDGTPIRWDEEWRCAWCGHEFWVPSPDF